MNIFEVLNQGNSRLHEPSISAMLGYLLDTRRDHGLGDTFFREFLSLLNREINDSRFNEYLEKPFIDTDVLLEEPYELNNSTKYIDIQISILNKDVQENRQEDFRIIIENKIKDSSVSEGQLESYYQAIVEDESVIDNLAIVYLTPFSKRTSLKSEYKNLNLRDPKHLKAWIKWNDNDHGIIKILRKILKKESVGEINPINEYTRHTIKAFIQFLNATVSSAKDKTHRFGEDIGEIVDSVTLAVEGEEYDYRIVRRDSQQIQVFTKDGKVTAKPVLRKIIKNRNLDIPLSGINTRTMGRKVIDQIKQKQ
ncbi:PD-(D/E)XK nuclease family protein [Gracilimonas sp.]|uniref:PD-(D/E)XK nuclease family protein n=1 Tax=Gracilimonas sp. TaxID=1974203 RepID=UPI003BA8921C